MGPPASIKISLVYASIAVLFALGASLALLKEIKKAQAEMDYIKEMGKIVITRPPK